MKRQLSLILVLMLVLSMALSGCTNDKDEKAALFVAGTYEGEGQGHAGKIKVAVTVTEQKIEKIELIEFSESEFAVDPANKLIENIIKANSGEVDGVSGATVTSGGILEAVRNALASAYVEGASNPGVATTEAASDVALENKTADIVVIGAGGAGLTAAIEAADRGANVIVVEKMPMVGGNTKYATGGLNAAGTTSQAELGIEDSIELFYEDTMVGGGNINNPELVRVLAENGAGTVEWLKGIGADLSDVGRLAGASVNRSHRPTGGAPVGNHIVDVLYAKAQEMEIEVLLESEVIALLGDATGVTGVTVQTSNGNYQIDAKAVIIASGGFGANNDLVEIGRAHV